MKTCSHAKTVLIEITISKKATNMSPIRSTWNPGVCRILTLLTNYGNASIVNSVKLHLITFKLSDVKKLSKKKC